MNTPPTPADRPPQPVSEAEAPDLLAMGLSQPGSAPSRGLTVPSAEDLAARFPDLEIMELLGQGGMGAVYRARQRKLDRLVALKVMPEALSRDPAFAERFTREARALAKLHHPHVVGVYEYGEKQGLHYLLMEYVDGVTLRHLMSSGSLSPKDALSIVPQICEALQYAHDQGVVHRDVKPENILLDRHGKVRVADFGLAKLAEPGAADFTLTGTHQVMGTLHYMAPEQYKTPGDVDHRADIFSLGVVFYEMLTGELPVGNFKQPSADAEVDARLDEIVMRALERERDQRYQNVKDVEADVETVLNGPAPRDPGARRRPLSRMHDRHDARRAARSDTRPLSAWAIWSWILAVSAAPVGFAIWGFVYNVSTYPTASYDGTAIGLMVSLCIVGLAIVASIIAIVRTGRHRETLRGRGSAITCLVICLVGGTATASGFAAEMSVMRRSMRVQAEWEQLRAGDRPVRPGDHIEVKGLGTGASPWPIREAVLASWDRYVWYMRSGEGTVAGALRESYYDDADARKFYEDDPAVMSMRAKAGVYGIGAMGQGHLPAPPWEFELRLITLDRWEREATVRAWHKGPARLYRLQFKVKLVDGRWVFVMEPPVIYPNEPLADEDK